MSHALGRRVAALESQGGAGTVIRVVPPAIAADPARFATWRTEAAAAAPAGARVVPVITGVPRQGDPA